MNTKNNARRRESRRRIQEALAALLEDRDLDRVTVTAICERAQINRSTFYASYRDVYDLAESLRAWIERQMGELYRKEREQGFNSNDYLRIFRHIYQNQDTYRLYFKLGLEPRKITRWDDALALQEFDGEHIAYHAEFFRAGVTAMIRLWLSGGCRETPEQMNEVLMAEYRGRVRRGGPEENPGAQGVPVNSGDDSGDNMQR